MKWYIDSVERNSINITSIPGNLPNVTKYLGVLYNPAYGGNPETYTEYFTGDILLFGYFIDIVLSQAEVTLRYNYWSFHAGLYKLRWGSNIDDGVGSNIATDVLGGVPCVLATAPADPEWRLYGVYADPVFNLWSDWDDLFSMFLLPFGEIAVAAQVIVAACSAASNESYYDTSTPECETKYDAEVWYKGAIDFEHVYIGHKFL